MTARRPAAPVLALLALLAVLGAASAREHGAAAARADFAAASTALEAGTAAGDEEALAAFGRAADAFAALGDAAAAAESRYGSGVALARLRRHDQARAAYRAARQAYRALGDRRGEGAAVNNLALLDAATGRPLRALDGMRQALRLRRQAGDAAGEAASLHNLGALHAEVGDAQPALDAFRRALDAHRALGDLAGQAASLNNLALVEAQLGRFAAAAAHYREARRHHRALGDRRGEAGTESNLALLDLVQGERARAAARLRRAAERFRAAGDRHGEGTALANLALAHLEAGDLEAAEQALAAARAGQLGSGDRRAAAALASLAGRLRAAGGMTAAGIAGGRRALAAQQRLGDVHGAVETLLWLARAARDGGDLDTAEGFAHQAVAQVESRRAPLIAESLRASYLARRREVYALQVELLVARHRRAPQAGFDAQAFTAADRARARGLNDLLAGLAGSVATAGPAGHRVAPAAAGRLDDLRRRIHAGERARQRLLQEGRDHQAAAAERRVAALIVDYEEAAAALRGHPDHAEGDTAISVEPAPAAALLAPRTLLLAYHLGERRSTLFALDREGLAIHDLPPRAVLEEAAATAHRLLAGSHQRAFQAPAKVAAQRLATLALAPVADRLAAAERLVVIADGALHYVPFAALPPPGSAADAAPLGLRHALVSIPSVATLARLRARRDDRLPGGAARGPALAVIADPVFSAADPRLSGRRAGDTERARAAAPPAGFDHLPRLPHSRREAQQLAAIAGPLEARLWLDTAAERRLFFDGSLAHARRIHVASHALIHDREPLLSGLVLSTVDAAGRPRDGLLRLLDLSGLTLEAELVVLSGCRTALGPAVDGEGLVSLARAFFSAGVPRLVVSLWQVDDQASAAFMTAFYRALLEAEEPAADALRTARRTLARDLRFRAPAHWAAFVLEGDG